MNWLVNTFERIGTMRAVSELNRMGYTKVADKIAAEARERWKQ